MTLELFLSGKEIIGLDSWLLTDILKFIKKKISNDTIIAPNIFNPMKPKKLPYKLFLKSFEFAPRPAVNLLIEQMEVSQTSSRSVKFAKLNTRAVLLTKRRQPPFAGYWHLPGSFVLNGEALLDCVNRVAKEELGIKAKGVELAGAFDDIDGDPRGHVVDLVYRCRIESGVSWRRQETPGEIGKI